MGWEAASSVATGGAGHVACSNERGAPVRRVSPALSLSLWPRLSVITLPLSESILGSHATRASVSLSVSPHFGLFSVSSFLFPLICFIPLLDLSLYLFHHHQVTFVTLGVVS